MLAQRSQYFYALHIAKAIIANDYIIFSLCEFWLMPLPPECAMSTS